AAEAAQRRLDALTKPPGSLGRLEELARTLCRISGQCPPPTHHAVIFTLAGDHGVVEERVSAYPQIVTSQMVENFLRGGAAVNVLARQMGAGVVGADLGVAAPLGDRPGLRALRIAPGTANFTRVPAMTREQAERAVDAGIALVEEARPGGLDLIGTGEMGIGNTTAASAITAAITGASAREVTGRGTGVDDATWMCKALAVEGALALHRPDPRDGARGGCADQGGGLRDRGAGRRDPRGRGPSHSGRPGRLHRRRGGARRGARRSRRAALPDRRASLGRAR